MSTNISNFERVKKFLALPDFTQIPLLSFPRFTIMTQFRFSILAFSCFFHSNILSTIIIFITFESWIIIYDSWISFHDLGMILGMVDPWIMDEKQRPVNLGLNPLILGTVLDLCNRGTCCRNLVFLIELF